MVLYVKMRRLTRESVLTRVEDDIGTHKVVLKVDVYL